MILFVCLSLYLSRNTTRHAKKNSPSDVEAGICLHNEEGSQLMRVTKVEELADTSASSDACGRCSDSANFKVEETDTGSAEPTCICTPECGSCDPNPVLSDEDSGYMCINLSAYVAAEESGGAEVKATLVPNTGGVKQGNPYGGSAECSFGRTYRKHKRGTKYDAAVSNIPTDSIVIIDMDKMEKKCTVNLPATPGRVLYAPNEPVDIKSMTSTNAGSAAATVYSVYFVMSLSMVMIVVGSMGIVMS